MHRRRRESSAIDSVYVYVDGVISRSVGFVFFFVTLLRALAYEGVVKPTEISRINRSATTTGRTRHVSGELA
jgi:hypothetical protein